MRHVYSDFNLLISKSLGSIFNMLSYIGSVCVHLGEYGYMYVSLWIYSIFWKKKCFSEHDKSFATRQAKDDHRGKEDYKGPR